MANPHSLLSPTYLPPPEAPAKPTISQRLPIGPTALNTSPGRSRSGSTSAASALHARSQSGYTTRSRADTTGSTSAPSGPSSPTAGTFHHAHTGSGATHAGGVLPPLPFFRPARPNNYGALAPNPAARPLSLVSTDSERGRRAERRTSGVPSLNAGAGDRRSRAYSVDVDSDREADTETSDYERGRGAGAGVRTRRRADTVGTDSEREDYAPPSPGGARVHKSREPLLPIGGGSGAGRPTQSSRPAHPHPLANLNYSAPSHIPTGSIGLGMGPSIGGTMRTSFERIFRRVSLEAGAVGLDAAAAAAMEKPEEDTEQTPAIAATGMSAPARDGRSPDPDTSLSSPRTSGYKRRSSSPFSQYGGAPRTQTLHFAPAAGPSAPFGSVLPLHASPVPSVGASAGAPPLSAVPRSDAAGRAVRRHAVHPSRNRFFLGGRLLTGGDAPTAFVGSVVVALGIAGAWLGTTCVWWWRNVSPAVAGVGIYMVLLALSSMMATALRDPGVLPRGLDEEPPTAGTLDGSVREGSAGHAGSMNSGRVPLPRDLKVRAGTVRVKYCSTCKTYRPPRSSHCKMCDNCVEGCDHHCQWVNNCVGHRNYTSFFTFLMSSVLTLILVICTSAIHLYLLTRRDGLSFKDALAHGAGSAVAFCLSVAVIWPITALLVYHMRLLLLNVTTIEQIRNQAHRTLVPGPAPPNPFTHGSWRRNLGSVLCRPEGYSWLDGHGVATEDRREVNPGMGAGGGRGGGLA